ncbi:MAG: response regulator [Hylemonella sp.]|nr:response regulator [Hylemonella sp.]
MKLKDLIDALADEVELVRSQMDAQLDKLATLDADDPAFMEALDQYSGQAQRMGEAAEMAGFPGLQAVCAHVMQNSLLLASQQPDERPEMIQFLREWPPLIVYHLRNLSDPSTAAGLVDHLIGAPLPMDEEEGLKIMHMLGAMPLQIGLPGGDGGGSKRPVLATAADVALEQPDDVDRKVLEGFLHEAPEQARHLVFLARNMTAGEGDSSDVIAARRIVHTLKGSGAIVGLRGIASLGHHLEDILDHFENEGGHVTKQVADTLLDAAYCLEQMIGYVGGTDDFPAQATGVLQSVLDLANRIDRGESLDQPVLRSSGSMSRSIAAEAKVGDFSPPPQEKPVTPGVTTAPTAALRVSLDRIEEMFRSAGELSVNGAAMENQIKQLVDTARDLMTQNLRVQKRLFELETVVDVRTLTMMRARSQRTETDAFDPLEMDQYNELHSTTHALVEEASDARALALRLEQEMSHIVGLQARQQRLNKDMQDLVTGTRITQVGVLESRMQRNIRTTCQSTGKQAMLIFQGSDTLVDSDLLNRLAEPLLHLLRNAVDHGIELPQERLAAGKPETGTIALNFSRQGQQIVLRCQDDGRGLDLHAIRRRSIERGMITAEQTMSDDEIARLILMPGFSTRDTISEVSGRGVGLDVVREWVSALNGSIRIASQLGHGCTIELRFAASLSTVQSLIVEAAAQRFALPAIQVEQAVPRGVGQFELMGDQLVYRHERRTLRATHLASVASQPIDPDRGLDLYDAVIVNIDDKAQALAVDSLIDARELLVKSPGRYARNVRGVAGLSLLGDGSVAVNLDLNQLLGATAQPVAVRQAKAADSVVQKSSQLPSVLIVDDALTVRNSLLQLMKNAGYRAEAARDGLEAIDALQVFKPDLVLTDLEMPNMNGIELTSHIRARADSMKDLPVIMITSRSQDKHRQLAQQAGVDHYFTKPYNDSALLEQIRSALAA